MNEKFPDYQEKIRSYLRGELSKPEEEALLDWVNQSHENLGEFQAFVRDNQFNINSSGDSEKAWERFQVRLGKREHKPAIAFLHSRWSKIAAILLIAMVAGFWGVRFWPDKQSETVFSELFVPFGEKMQIDLQDGTKVWLNSGTVFRYPEHFSEKTRTVEIVGEGFFEVAEDKSHPFIVKTPDFEVKVLGTSFNLSSYKDDEAKSLELLSGTVQLSTNDKQQKVKLVPGEKATLRKQENSLKITRTDTGSIASWRNNTLEFNDMSLLEISKLLERQFNVNIHIKKEELKQIKFSGRFKSDEGLDKLLKILKQTSPIELNYKHVLNKEEIIIE